MGRNCVWISDQKEKREPLLQVLKCQTRKFRLGFGGKIKFLKIGSHGGRRLACILQEVLSIPGSQKTGLYLIISPKSLGA